MRKQMLTGFAGHYQLDTYSWHRPALSDDYNQNLVPLYDEWTYLDLHKPSPHLGFYPVYALPGGLAAVEGEGVIVASSAMVEWLSRRGRPRIFTPFSPTHSFSRASHQVYHAELAGLAELSLRSPLDSASFFSKMLKDELALISRTFLDL